jgi:lactate permease
MIIDFRIGLFDVSKWKARSLGSKKRISLKISRLNLADIPAPSISEQQSNPKFANKSLIIALFPYLLLTIIIIVGQLILERPLSIFTINPVFPEVETSFGWLTEAGPGRSISILGHAGALLLYTSILSYLWFRSRGTLVDNDNYRFGRIAITTARGSVRSTIGIVTLVAMAVTMQHAGMTQILAQILSRGTGPIFPVLSPFIGALGAFMTGSNTNSNVVFGQLQLETAISLGLSVALILASQTTGGAIGSLFAPAKVVVGSSTVAGASEGKVLKKATIYGLLMLFALGVVSLLIASLTD